MAQQQIRDKAVVIRVSDYKDYDRLLRVFTLDNGIITLIAKGVKRAKAKLKHIAQPFCIFEGVFVKSGNFYTLASAEALENTMRVCAEPVSYAVCSVITEAADKALYERAPAQGAFVSLLKAFKQILYGTNFSYAGCVFMLDLIRLAGFEQKYEFYPMPKSPAQLMGYAQERGYCDFADEALSLKTFKLLCREFCQVLDCSLSSLKFLNELGC